MDLTNVFPQRPKDVHKGSYGSVLVVGGSKMYGGAATLAAVGALRAGADLVSVTAPMRAADIAANTQVDLITYPLKGDYLSSGHIADIMDVAHIRKINSVVIGCGLGRNQATTVTIHKLIHKFIVPMVIDADGLRAISTSPGFVLAKHCILTPHLGELAVLLGVEKVNDDFESRLSGAKAAAEKFRSTVLLKGNVDIITDGTTTITNNSGTPFMTVGGTGDVLSGVVAALLARGVGLIEAAHAGAYINGKAGELAGEKYGEGMTASDMFEEIPRVIKG